MIDNNQPFEANLKAIGHHLGNLSVMDESISITLELKRRTKEFLVHDERLFCRTKYVTRFVPHIQMREISLKAYTMKSETGISIRHTPPSEIVFEGRIFGKRSLSLRHLSEDETGQPKGVGRKDPNQCIVSHLVHRIRRTVTSNECSESILDRDRRTDVKVARSVTDTRRFIQFNLPEGVR